MTREIELCEHGYPLGKCPEEMCLHRREVKIALLGLAGSVTAAFDQAHAMTDSELGTLLTTGRWSTVEVHEAGSRLLASRPYETEDELIRYAARLAEALRTIAENPDWCGDGSAGYFAGDFLASVAS